MSVGLTSFRSRYDELVQRHRQLPRRTMSNGVRKCILVCMAVVSVICYKSYTTERHMISPLNFYNQDIFPSRPVNWGNTKYRKVFKSTTELPPSVRRQLNPTAPGESLADDLDFRSSIPKFDLVENHLNAQITSPRKSTFEIVGLKNKYQICDKLHVIIQARDEGNQPKQIGGDYFRARIYNEKVSASSSSNGPITDHGNGTYSAYFTLPWIGLVNIEVTLVLPSEVIGILTRIYRAHPYRMVYEGKFQSGGKIEVTKCHVYLNTSLKLCNFTDEMSGQPWFCVKPKHLPCSSWIEHHGNPLQTEKISEKLLLDGESAAFKTKNIRRILRRLQPLAIKVQSNDQLEGYHLCKANLPTCTRNPNKSTVNRGMVAGFYYRDIWHSNVCNAKYIGRSATKTCLRNKRLYFYGDSTLRQWHNYLLAYLPTLDNVTYYEHKSTYKVGPLTALDRKNNFTAKFFHHGLPIRNTWMLTKNLNYEFKEIDKLNADENTVVVLNLWAHFTSVSLDDYRSRLICVRNALIRLYQRSPRTLVIIKSANTRSFAYTPTSTINFNDWYVMKLDSVMHNVLKDVPNIVIINVWDMTNCHRTGSDVHPHDLVVREEMKMMLSYVCSGSNTIVGAS